jgi:Bacterial Ig-like domain (group 3)/FG-GAP-like repeat
MTRKLTRNTSVLRGIAPFIAVLTIMIALAALAQTRGTGKVSGKSRATSGLRNVGGPLLAQERPVLLGGNSAERGAVVRSQSNGFAASAMGPSAPFFLPPVIYDPKGYGAVRVSVAIADVNGDGKPDLLVANRYACPGCNGSVAVLLGNGDGTFQPAVTYDSGNTATEKEVVSDVNGDGKPDLVVGNDCGGCSQPVGVLLGNGDGTFQPAATYEDIEGVASIAIADVNGDGKLDVVALGPCPGPGDLCSNGGGAVSVLRGHGDGTFGPGSPFYDSGGRYPKSIEVADLNGDSKPDVVVANLCTSQGCTQGGVVGVLLGTGDTVNPFQPVVVYSGGSRTVDVAIADVNGDGKPDILEVDFGGAGVLLGNGDGTFQPRVGYDTGGSTCCSLVVADVNGDGKLDLIVGNELSGTVAVLLGNGDGTFQPAVTQAESDPRSLAVADLNGDGRLDLVVGTSDGNNTPLVGVMLHVGAVPSKTKVVASLNPSVFGQSVKFTATVSSGSGTPPGTVIFFDGSTSLGSATLVNGHGSISTSVLQAGSHSITAVYQGSLKFNSSVSAPLPQVVNPATTTTSLASSLNPALITEFVTYTATVASQYGGAVTGTVMFEDGGSTVATVTMVGDQAAYTTKYTTPGTHSITATYSGDTNNTGSVSSALVEQINRGVPSKTVLTTSGSPSFVGQPVTFTATVTPNHGTIPDGELVTFFDGMTEIGTGTTTSGVATFTTSSLTLKTHTIKGTYPGDAVFQSSTGSVTQVVEGYPTTTTLSSSPNPSQFGQAVTFTAQVTSTGPVPTGKVKFLDGTTTLGAAVLSGGTAKITKSTLAVGTHPITAQYLGDAVSDKSTSSVVNQVVQ